MMRRHWLQNLTGPLGSFYNDVSYKRKVVAALKENPIEHVVSRWVKVIVYSLCKIMRDLRICGMDLLYIGLYPAPNTFRTSRRFKL